MIQRIQTLYLFAAFGLLVGFMFIPLAVINNHLVTTSLNVFGSHDGVLSGLGSKGMNITHFLSGMVSVILLYSIFLYKNRNKQIKISMLSLYMLILIEACLCFTLFIGTVPNSIISYHIAVIFPLVSAVLVLLAINAIKKDEALVKSNDRLR